MNPHVLPVRNKESFTCPHCQVVARQEWYDFAKTDSARYACARCENCRDVSIWADQLMVYPMISSAPPPNPDMPDGVKKIFEEARGIFGTSPRASAGLLRICVEKITEELGEKDGDLNARIARLIERGLDRDIAKALDIVRVTGNDQLHAGQIDLSDAPEEAQSLFDIVNIIVQRMVSDKKQIEDMYGRLPQEKRDGITNRDKNNNLGKNDK